MTKKRDLSHRQTFEEQGETWVRHLLLTTSDQDTKAQASAWLDEKRIEREEVCSSKRDAREEETLAIAKRANTIAISAIIFATIAALFSAIMSFLKTP